MYGTYCTCQLCRRQISRLAEHGIVRHRVCTCGKESGGRERVCMWVDWHVGRIAPIGCIVFVSYLIVSFPLSPLIIVHILFIVTQVHF